MGFTILRKTTDMFCNEPGNTLTAISEITIAVIRIRRESVQPVPSA